MIPITNGFFLSFSNFLSQVAIDIKNFSNYKSDIDFTSDLVAEQSVFTIPSSVSSHF